MHLMALVIQQNSMMPFAESLQLEAIQMDVEMQIGFQRGRIQSIDFNLLH